MGFLSRAMGFRVGEKEVKEAIVKSKLPGADYVLNPYVGCSHGCIYCYADFMKRFSGHENEEWGSFVDVKINASEKINSDKIKKDSLILIGSVTDPYQPLERKYGITRKCLERLKLFQPRVEILTKSSLVLRDLDLLKQFDDLRVGISVGILREDYAKELEPRADLPAERIRVLKKLHEEGIKNYLFISPIFPEISDFKKIVDSVADFVDEIWFENLKIRPNNRQKIFEFLQRNRPGLIEFYNGLRRDSSYWRNLKKEILDYCNLKGVSCKIYFGYKG